MSETQTLTEAITPITDRIKVFEHIGKLPDLSKNRGVTIVYQSENVMVSLHSQGLYRVDVLLRSNPDD